MKLSPSLIAALIVLAVTSPQLPAGETAFAPNSRWTPVNESGTVTGAARDGDAIILRGTGSGLAGAGGRAALTHRYIGDPLGYTMMTARLVSLDGGGGMGEAGIRIEIPAAEWGGEAFGMRLFFRRDGTLHWESRIFSFPVQPGPPVFGLSLPLWLRIEWRGGGLVGSYSPSGSIWTELTPMLPITLPPIARPALIVSSQGNAVAANARFDNVWMSAGDADDNGIADGWEMEHFQRLLGADASADPDGDLTKNVDEWMWRMDPKQPDLRPQLQAKSLTNGSLLLTLPGFRSSNYPWTLGIESAPAPEGPWEEVPLGASQAPNFWLTATVSPSPARLFFRGVIRLP